MTTMAPTMLTIVPGRWHPADIGDTGTAIYETGDGRRILFSESGRALVDALIHRGVVREALVELGQPCDHDSLEKTEQFVNEKLVGRGLASWSGESVPSYASVRRSRRLWWQCAVLSPDLVSTCAGPLRLLFLSPIVVWSALSVLVCTAVVLLLMPLPAANNATLVQPGRIAVPLIAWGVTMLFHELGHAAALRQFGGNPGAIGIGVLGVVPVLYAELGDAWRLSRTQRTVVDGAGIVAQGLVALALDGVLRTLGLNPWVVTFERLVAVSVLIAALPAFGMDGHWLLRDALGTVRLRSRALIHFQHAQTSSDHRVRTHWSRLGQVLLLWYVVACAVGIFGVASLSVWQLRRALSHPLWHGLPDLISRTRYSADASSVLAWLDAVVAMSVVGLGIVVSCVVVWRAPRRLWQLTRRVSDVLH